MTLVEVALRAVSVLAAFLVLPLLVGQTEHKLMAHMQGRLGPMYAGGFHGWAQLVADGAKFVQKEDIVPAAADKRLFRLAPAIALIPYLVALAVVPIAPGVAGLDVPASAILVLVATGVGALGTLIAGWASANKYALIGALRAAAQLISYELPIVLAVASVCLAGGSLSLPTIALAALAVARCYRLSRRRGRRAPAAPLRHPGRRCRTRHGAVDGVHRAPLRLLPARRVCRDRGAVPPLRRAVAGWVARTLQ